MTPASTHQLIDVLARDVPAVHRRERGARLLAGLVAGGAIAAALVVACLGLRPDLDQAALAFPFWMKWTYTASVGALALLATVRLARPTERSLRSLRPILIPALLLAGIAIGDMAHEPLHGWSSLWLGRTWPHCPWLIWGLSLPIFAGLLQGFRRLAPTDLRAAGAAAGFAAGAWAAALYSLSCPEDSAAFVLAWYNLGILLAGASGALFGPRLLRW